MTFLPLKQFSIKKKNYIDSDEHVIEEQQTATSNETAKELPSQIKKQMCANKYNFATPSAPQKKFKGREGRPESSPASQPMAYLLAEKQTQKETALNSETCIKHPVDAFLDGIAPTLKMLDPVFLNEAKGKIFAVVQDYELKQLHLNRQDRYVIPNYSAIHFSSTSSSSSAPSPNYTQMNYSTFPATIQSPLSVTHASPAYPIVMPNNDFLDL